MALDAQFEINDPSTPIIAVALHDGHTLRSEIEPLFAIRAQDRLREEDPHTGLWTQIVNNRIIVNTSRFEIDLNRPKSEAVYIDPESTWGLQVWKEKPTAAIIERSLEVYDAFYKEYREVLSQFQKRFKQFVVLDLHAYNYLREGPEGPPADPEKNPEVNIGTGTMKRERWAPLVDRFIADLNAFDYLGRNLDVRENVKFYGRQLAQFTHDHFPESACVLAVEFKKFFMNEWTGEADPKQLDAISAALRSTLSGLLEELKCA